MLNKQVVGLLGLANVSRNVVTGEKILSTIRNGKAKLVIVAEDASDNTKKLYQDKCNSFHCECIILGTMDEISQAIGKFNRAAIAIVDANFAKKIMERKG